MEEDIPVLETDSASAALIAEILRQEALANPYYDYEYADEDFEDKPKKSKKRPRKGDDDDYDPKKKTKGMQTYIE
jgi:hypothetical protein